MNSLRPSERARYNTLKAEIRAGLLGVARALMEIRDGRLYEEEYGSFVEFVEHECGFSRARAYQLIAAAKGEQKVIESSIEAPSLLGADDVEAPSKLGAAMNTKVLEAVADIPSDKVPEVLEQATEGGTKPATAAAVKRVKGEIVNDGLNKRDREIQQFRNLRSVAVKHVEALMRTVDSLNDARMNPGTHRKLIQMCESMHGILTGWPE